MFEHIKMPEKSPEVYTLITYLWIILASILGGLVKFMNRVKGTRTWHRFASDVITGVFCGLSTFYFCQWQELPVSACAFFCSISANMGVQAIYVMRQVFVEFFSYFKK